MIGVRSVQAPYQRFQFPFSYVVPFGAAVSLTFERTGFLSFVGRYDLHDVAINVFVVVVAPLFALWGCLRNASGSQLPRYLPFIPLVAWIVIRGTLFGVDEYAPNRTVLLTCAVGIILGSNITRADLPCLRRSLMVLGLVFSVLVCLFERNTLADALSGSLQHRLGADVSAAVAIAFPRTVYTLVIACAASLIIEKNLLLRGLSLALIPIPILLGFAAAGRGGLLGLGVATLVLLAGLPVVLGTRRKALLSFALAFLATAIYVAYEVVLALFPLLTRRITTEGDSGRFGIWAEVFEDISLFGRGPDKYYAHNLFFESLQDYGIVGLILLLVFLVAVSSKLRTAWRRHADMEILWVTAVIALQFSCQQLSLHIYWGFFWTAMVLPLGLNLGPQPASPRRPTVAARTTPSNSSRPLAKRQLSGVT